MSPKPLSTPGDTYREAQIDENIILLENGREIELEGIERIPGWLLLEYQTEGAKNDWEMDRRGRI